MASPAVLNLPAAASRSRFDELQQSHAMSVDVVHNVGAFLPYHRFFLHTHEHLLRTLCNYTSAQPYWDEPLDAGNFPASPLLSPTTGFGGNGVGETHCIADGPFKDYINPIGPGSRVTNHCINRNLGACESVYASKLAAPQFVSACMALPTFGEFWPCVEFAAHTAGHGGIGGEMLDLVASPGDPLFYLHHAYLDKLWWEWQARDLPARLAQISGNNACPGFPGAPPAQPETLPWGPRAVVGDPGNVTTLGHVLTVDGALPDVTIGDVMDIRGGGLLCYEYV
ncbi:Di-copper centre-containing protein [Melanomma pulvis-pyrius CBS 109.77]|uniref:Di-copper centre-containing protein n=1 Tax=Melanomma pulvis-pyrius CBS 109.77 TaxID=1314802 RepID=A0A6A6WW42_9PLEO|nr:Di-copper centre-containing protein [Melanomma pulvis-pyrius CBS 109.77]